MYDVTIDPDITAQIRRYLLSSVSEYGMSRHTEWMAEDNWIVGYSTSPIEKSFKYDGKFAVVVWKPNRRKDPDRWSIVYYRAFRRRKDAKVRALQLYAKHSPRWAARNGEIDDEEIPETVTVCSDCMSADCSGDRGRLLIDITREQYEARPNVCQYCDRINCDSCEEGKA